MGDLVGESRDMGDIVGAVKRHGWQCGQSRDMGDLGGSQETWMTLWEQSTYVGDLGEARDMGDLGGSQ